MSQLKQAIIRSAENIMYHSLKTVARSRGEVELGEKLEKIVPDNSNQYTSFKIPEGNRYLTTKVRNQHAFQMSIFLRAIERLRAQVGAQSEIKIADIGDSSGTHTIYLKALAKNPELLKIKSVNLDPVAIEKIRLRGLDAIHCRAENLQSDHGFSADLFSAFEVLEHLMDPIRFMREIAQRTGCKYFVITVPLVHKSRMGLQYIRHQFKGDVVAENTHIFELSPEDWKLLFKFSGWKVVEEDLYHQYPSSFHPLALTKALWRKLDVDGFYGVILERDLDASNRYQSW